MKNKCIASLYCDTKIDFTEEPMFLGAGKNLQRYDVFSYEIFDKINDKMQSLFWRPPEIDLNKDALDVKNSEEHELFILTTVIQKLTFLDSIMGRGPFLTFGQIVSIPELEGAILTWDFFESIHSRSYSWILQNCYADPSKIFDEIYDIKEIKNIAEFISRNYNEFYKEVTKHQYYKQNDIKVTDEDLLNLKKALLRLLMVVNCLEGIEFLSGFSAVWALTENKGIFPGTSKILQLISRDELQHLRLTQHINKILRDNKSEGFSELWNSMTTEFYNIYLEAVELEEKFIDLTYSKGSIIGMNADIAKQYLHYVTNQRLKTLGLKTMYPEIKNPIQWIDRWYDVDGNVGALQEIENTDYKMGGISFDTDEDKTKKIYDFI